MSDRPKPVGSGYFAVFWGVLFAFALAGAIAFDFHRIPPRLLLGAWLGFAACILLIWGMHRIKSGDRSRKSEVGQDTINWIVSILVGTFVLLALLNDLSLPKEVSQNIPMPDARVRLLMPFDVAFQFFGQKTAEHPNDLTTIWVALIAAGSAVFGATIGGLVTFFTARTTAKNQAQIEEAKLKATVIANERLRWLQDIRIRLAKVCAKMDMQYNLLQRPISPAPQQAARQQQLDDLSNDIMTEANVIYLMLNPAKLEQKDLRDSLQKAQGFLLGHFAQPSLASSSSSLGAYSSIKQAIFDAATAIGVETWRKIKRLQ